jgi:Flp pilus assembly protein TadD
VPITLWASWPTSTATTSAPRGTTGTVWPRPRDSPTLHNNLGYSHYLAGNNQAAITEFREALALDPNYARAWRNLGLVYSRQGKYEKALAAFRKVQDLPQAYNDVGYIAMVAGRLDDAQSFFDEAQRLSPEYYPTASDNARRVRALKGK